MLKIGGNLNPKYIKSILTNNIDRFNAEYYFGTDEKTGSAGGIPDAYEKARD